MFSIRRNYYYLYIQWKIGLLLYFIFNKKNYKKGLASRKGKGKRTTFLFLIKRENFLQWKTLGDSLFNYLFYVKMPSFFFFFFFFEIIQIEYIEDREGGNRKTRLTTLALTKRPNLCKYQRGLCETCYILYFINHHINPKGVKK